MTPEDQIQDLFKFIEQDKCQALGTLLESGCNPNICRRKTPALIYAVVKKKIRCIKILLHYGVIVDKKDSEGMTACMFACIYDEKDILALLYQAGSDLKLAASDGMTALMHAAIHNSVECLAFIINSVDKIDLNSRDCEGNTALMHSVKHKNMTSLQFLLDKGADVNQRNDAGQSPLGQAVYMGCLRPAAYILVQRGADVNIEDNSGNTPLATAFEFAVDVDIKENGSCQFIEQLLLKGAKPSFQMQKSSYLHEMIVKNQIQVVRLMIINGFRPIDVACTGATFYFDCESIKKPISPLGIALLSNSVDIAKYLLANSFLTKFDTCILACDKAILKFLETHSYTQCLDLLSSMFSRPLRLKTLSLAIVSDMWLASSRKQRSEYRKQIEEVLQSLKNSLYCRPNAALLHPGTWNSLEIDFNRV